MAGLAAIGLWFGGAVSGGGGGDRSPGGPPGEAGSPLFDLYNVFTWDGRDPVARILGFKDGRMQVADVPINGTFDGYRFVEWLPNEKTIIVEREDQPGTRYRVGPAKELPPPGRPPAAGVKSEKP